MAYVDKSEALWQTVAEIAADEGMSLYDLERSGHGGLKVVIHKLPNVTSGDCSRLCRRLMVLFTAEGPKFDLSAEPEIEVSSPGVNRHLRLPVHFSGALGERVKVVAAENGSEAGHPKRMSIIGTLSKVDEDRITVIEENSSREFEVALNKINRAHVEFKF